MKSKKEAYEGLAELLLEGLALCSADLGGRRLFLLPFLVGKAKRLAAGFILFLLLDPQQLHLVRVLDADLLHLFIVIPMQPVEPNFCLSRVFGRIPTTDKIGGSGKLVRPGRREAATRGVGRLRLGVGGGGV